MPEPFPGHAGLIESVLALVVDNASINLFIGTHFLKQLRGVTFSFALFLES